MIGEQRDDAEDCGRHGRKTIIAQNANIRVAPEDGRYGARDLP
jgi:hypothetical protein